MHPGFRPPAAPLLTGRRRLLLSGLAGLGLLLAGCKPEEGEDYRPRFSDDAPRQGQVYVFGIHPLHNPQRLFEVYQPLVELLNRSLGGPRIRLEASRNYASFETKLAERHFHFALPNPYQTVTASGQGYRVFGKMADDREFRGIILVRKDGGIADAADLRGKAVSYPAPTALAATMLPQWFLHRQGIDVQRDLDNRYVGSQESSIMNVFLGATAAGATWPAPWRAFTRERPDVAAKLEVKWETEPLLNNSLVVRDDVPEALVRAVAAQLFALHATPEGRAILAPMELSRFEPADDSTYQAVRDFLVRFEREVRPIKERS